MFCARCIGVQIIVTMGTSTSQIMLKPRWLKINQASDYANIGRDELKRLVKSGVVRGYQRGKRKDFIIDRYSLDEYHLAQISTPKHKALEIIRSL